MLFLLFISLDKVGLDNGQIVQGTYTYKSSNFANTTNLALDNDLLPSFPIQILWSAQKQKVGATSLTEAEYIIASELCKEAIWLQMMILLILLPNQVPVTIPLLCSNKGDNATPLHCDNNDAVCLALNPQFHSRSKHFDIQYHNASMKERYQCITSLV